MKRRHVLDKFGHSQESHSLPLDVSGTHFNADYKHVRYLADPVEDHDAVTKSYLDEFWKIKKQELEEELSRKGKQGGGGFLGLNDEQTAWDAKGLRVTNAASGDKSNDLSVVGQACTYDESIKAFRCGLKTYNLVETSANNPVVVTTRLSAFGPLELAEYDKPDQPVMPTNYARWEPDSGQLVFAKHKQLVWDEKNKKFCERQQASWYSRRPTRASLDMQR